MKKKISCFVLFSFLLLLYQPAWSHPHVFVDAKLKIIIDKDNKLQKLVEDWDFDPVFSAGVIMDFAKNKKKLTEKEHEKLSKTIHNSVAYYGYFQCVKSNGKEIKIAPPYKFEVKLDKILKIHLEAKPEKPITFERKRKYAFRVLDPTFYVNIAYKKNADIQVEGLPTYCKMKIIRPDADKVLQQDQSQYTEEFFMDPNNASSLSMQLATRLEISC